MSRRIAIVEDEPAIRANYADALRRHGYEVAAYASRPEAMAAFRTRLPDLAVIDVGLGDEPTAASRCAGSSARCRRRCRSSSCRRAIPTSTSSRDCASAPTTTSTKDASLHQLTARIAALFRRVDLLAAPPSIEDVVRRGELELDVKRMTAKWRGATLPLTLTEFWMVHALARHPGHVKDRDALMRDANIVVDDATITSHVKRIRRKFEVVDPAFDRIATVYGMGYRWLAEGGS